MNTDRLGGFQSDMQNILRSVNSIMSQFNSVSGNLDWDIKASSNISSRLSAISRALMAESRGISGMAVYLGNAKTKYSGLEKQNKVLKEVSKQTKTGAAAVNTQKASTNSTEGTQNVDGNSGTANSEKDVDSQFLALLKSMLKWEDKTGTGNGAGVAADGISYLESLYDFFTGDKKGLTGAEDWLDLGDKSASVWKGLYDYLNKFYGGAGEVFSEASQTKVAKVSVASSTLGFIGSLCGDVDYAMHTENARMSGIIGETVGSGTEAMDIWNAVERLEHIGDKTENITTRKGIYSPLTFYTAIAKGTISSTAQAFKSYEKYSADGSWDLNDTASTGVEFAVSGLYSMANTLTFGLFSEKTTGVTAADVSESLENWAGNIGTQAGEYIRDNSGLRDAYEKSHTPGKAIITFYAAFKSRF